MMKKLIILLLLSTVLGVNAQLFKGSEKSMMMLGATFAKSNAGLYFSYEERLGNYISLGINPVILLGKQSYINEDGIEKDMSFGNKFDLKGKLSIHFSEVLKIEKFDFYPGLNVGLHNLGFHAGAQLYVAEGFAAFAEGNIPIAKYKEDSPSSFDRSYMSAGLTIDIN